ncbi:hypothetical protein BRC90_11805 [Halobacteriales archaeon QS_4_69_34]|nr:MAG: hypothetical protein BRC90_11805 [Halobacteriales archaeon QS_4_69_34]
MNPRGSTTAADGSSKRYRSDPLATSRPIETIRCSVSSVPGSGSPSLPREGGIADERGRERRSFHVPKGAETLPGR